MLMTPHLKEIRVVRKKIFCIPKPKWAESRNVDPEWILRRVTGKKNLEMISALRNQMSHGELIVWRAEIAVGKWVE